MADSGGASPRVGGWVPPPAVGRAPPPQRPPIPPAAGPPLTSREAARRGATGAHALEVPPQAGPAPPRRPSSRPNQAADPTDPPRPLGAGGQPPAQGQRSRGAAAVAPACARARCKAACARAPDVASKGRPLRRAPSARGAPQGVEGWAANRRTSKTRAPQEKRRKKCQNRNLIEPSLIVI